MNAPCQLAPIPVVGSIAPLGGDRAAWLVDIWGVMHNGVRPFSRACEACTRFRSGGGVVLLLSNAPRPAGAVAAQLDRIGVPRAAWDTIITSGDAARALISGLGKQSIYHMGPDRDLPIYAGLSVRTVLADEAEAVVCTGFVDDEKETVEDYEALLKDFADRALPMVCANPDLTVERGNRVVPCAGALAARYEELEGAVRYAGKPHAPVYEMALAEVRRRTGANVELEMVLAIGDGIRTDIQGASMAGIQSVFIASGVHLPGNLSLDADRLGQLFAASPGRPIAAMTELAW